MEWHNGGFLITDERDRVDLDFVVQMLSGSYWAAGRPRAIVASSIANSLCFSLFRHGRQVGFARVVTDQATFAWICDVIIDPDYRHQGLGSWLLKCLSEHPLLRGTLQLLRTRDAHSFYAPFGFVACDCLCRRVPRQTASERQDEYS
ncbi:MAG: GNAT family N-acetyltransferase [Candidatus Promineifilaceae bacterium]